MKIRPALALCALFTFSAGAAWSGPLRRGAHDVAQVGRAGGHTVMDAGRGVGHVLMSAGRGVGRAVRRRRHE